MRLDLFDKKRSRLAALATAGVGLTMMLGVLAGEAEGNESSQRITPKAGASQESPDKRIRISNPPISIDIEQRFLLESPERFNEPVRYFVLKASLNALPFVNQPAQIAANPNASVVWRFDRLWEVDLESRLKKNAEVLARYEIDKRKDHFISKTSNNEFFTYYIGFFNDKKNKKVQFTIECAKGGLCFCEFLLPPISRLQVQFKTSLFDTSLYVCKTSYNFLMSRISTN